jgi:hypothetical protein
MTATPLLDLEALQARRDDLFATLCRVGGTPADWAELERITADLRAKLCDRLDAWSRERRTPDSPVVTIDPASADDWLESYAARDYLPESE